MCLGGLVDDIKEAGSAILGCFCCFMCAGPVLVVVGVAFLVSSLTDTRGIKIEQYENQLDFYSSKAWTFEGQDLWVQAHASTNTGTLTGSSGWQDVGKLAQWDATKSNAENKVRDSLYSPPPLKKGARTAYEWSAAATSSQPLSSNLTQHDQNLNQFFKLRVRNTNNDVVSESHVLRARVDNAYFLDYTPSKNTATGLDCYEEQYSSSYGTKHRAEIKRKHPTCKEYCEKQSGKYEWHRNAPASERAQCTQTFGLKRVAWRLCLGGASTTIESCPCSTQGCARTTAEKALPPYDCSGGTCKAGPDSEVLSENKFGTADSWNFEVTSWSNTSGADTGRDFHETQYGLVRKDDLTKFENSGSQGQHLAMLEVRVRWQQDPYILASALTKGCSSGAGRSFLYWDPSTGTTGEVSNSDNGGTGQCFGLTVEQKRQIGVACLVVGILCLLPVYCLAKWARGRKAKSAPPPAAGAGVQPVPQQQQYPVQQMVAQLPVVAGQPQQQYAVAGQPMQAQQPGQPQQQVVMMQGVQPGQQAVMVAQPVYAQQQVAMPKAPNYTA